VEDYRCGVCECRHVTVVKEYPVRCERQFPARVIDSKTYFLANCMAGLNLAASPRSMQTDVT